MLDPAELDNRYTHHPPEGDQAKRYVTLRAAAKLYAQTVEDLCPDSREKAIAQTHIQTASMFANAAIAITEADT